jgi:3'-phosphoadenosine 5'-phosphosulfate sulfotransferase (PAPS reductase)/FAD synthetase
MDATLDVRPLADRFERAEPESILRWALETVDRIAIASAFQAEGTCVLLHQPATDA